MNLTRFLYPQCARGHLADVGRWQSQLSVAALVSNFRINRKAKAKVWRLVFMHYILLVGCYSCIDTAVLLLLWSASCQKKILFFCFAWKKRCWKIQKMHQQNKIGLFHSVRALEAHKLFQYKIPRVTWPFGSNIALKAIVNRPFPRICSSSIDVWK